MSQSFHDRFVVIGRSVQKLAAQGRRPENRLPLICILVDVLSKCRQWISLWVPEAAAYTSRSRTSQGEHYENQKRGNGRNGRKDNVLGEAQGKEQKAMGRSERHAR
jgi:hypothetical protein